MIRAAVAVSALALITACASPALRGDRGIAATARDEAPLASREFTIEDHLRTEAIGKATVLGDLFVWEQAPPYDEIGYYGLGQMTAWGLAGFQLRAVEIDGGGPGKLLFDPAPGATYWIASTSPDGRYLLYYGAGEDGFFFGVYDRQAGVNREIAGAPAVGSRGNIASTWVSDSRFAIVTMADGVEPFAAARPSAGHRRYELEQEAWSGGVSATVSDTAAAPSPPPDRLLLVDASTGETTALAEGDFNTSANRAPLGSMAASHDGRYLAVVGVGMKGLSQAIQGPTDNAAGPRLVVFDLTTGEARALAADKSLDPLDPGPLEWSPSANDLAFFAWPKGGSKSDSVFHVASAETGEVTAYPHSGIELASQTERGWFQSPERAVWIGDRLAVYGRSYGGTAPRFVDQDNRRGAPGEDDHVASHWYLVDAEGRVEPLSSGLGEVSGIPLHADGRAITVLADGAVWRLEPGREPIDLTRDVGGGPVSHLPDAMGSALGQYASGRAILSQAGGAEAGFLLLDLATGSVRPVTNLPGDVQLLAGDVASGRLLVRRDGLEGTEIATTSADGEIDVVGAINQHLAGVIKTEWRPFAYEARIGGETVPLTGCALYPPDFDPEAAYPVIVDVYPGRTDTYCGAYSTYFRLGAEALPFSYHAMAAEGFIVLSPALPSSLIRTEEGPIVGAPALAEIAVDALGEAVGIDESRVYLFGLSQGAVTALWIATQSDRFDKVAALNGFSDLYTNYFESTYLQQFFEERAPIGAESQRYMVEGSDFRLGVRPHDAPMTYIRNSPLYRAPDISAPVLLVHSDLDAFSLSQFESMFAALKLAGKEARLVRYWGEGHAPSSPGNIRHLWDEIMTWYAD